MPSPTAGSGVRLPRLPKLRTAGERQRVVTFPSSSARVQNNADLEILGMACLQHAVTWSILETYPGIEKEEVETRKQRYLDQGQLFRYAEYYETSIHGNPVPSDDLKPAMKARIFVAYIGAVVEDPEKFGDVVKWVHELVQFTEYPPTGPWFEKADSHLSASTEPGNGAPTDPSYQPIGLLPRRKSRSVYPGSETTTSNHSAESVNNSPSDHTADLDHIANPPSINNSPSSNASSSGGGMWDHIRRGFRAPSHKSESSSSEQDYIPLRQPEPTVRPGGATNARDQNGTRRASPATSGSSVERGSIDINTQGNPAQQLHELVAQLKIPPFDLPNPQRVGGPDHSPIFRAILTCGELRFEAHRNVKKDAKNDVAQQFVDYLRGA